ncbi:single-stranded-DNA-specific exonuclease RecJ [Myxosarcina sp. GI1]|uniref:single-stranded-DNA-specific exonuclease RecJ n=1 Tax=Myxosarcina sp. GI1 TaxID=1541065 RepID=UPI00055E645F|nr:single-stranded-DNA-specific exonuclease RecJ [Myxosarcina sp. GI1]
MNHQTSWQIVKSVEIPQWFIDAVKPYANNSDGKYAAQLLWQRGIKDLKNLWGFLDPNLYSPASPFEFGEEMTRAIARIQQARQTEEKVSIWGDFDADGITSTSVLWDGLGQFFPQEMQLEYYIPNRLTESHGLNNSGIERLAASGTRLIVTCDTGSTNIAEINYAKELDIDIIVTDHHTLPESRPPVTAIINPRYLAKDHSLYHLSGVAVAYKLVEALYQSLPEIPQQPLEQLLDLVAIGLIADLVELKGDCRYLAQIGIEKLRQQLNPKTATRPGVTRLLELCRRTGDRPTDISFGIGPRINAVSRIHGDASFCIELLTSRDSERCEQLASETELANARRKALQQDVVEGVKQKLARLDLSTTSVIVLEDPQWQGGVLGLVAGQIAQEYARPTILLSSSNQNPVEATIIARGSARSTNNIDLYQLVKSQENLLHRFGGHPFAAGLSLPLENLPLFTEAINQQLRQQGKIDTLPDIEADLTVTVAELGKELFDELSLLEPCGMGNPVPRLLIKNCWFTNIWNSNIKDSSGRKIKYIKTAFKICDDSTSYRFPGVWWGHYREEIPQTKGCDAIVELDFNSYKSDRVEPHYEVRLIEVRSPSEKLAIEPSTANSNSIIDRRHNMLALDILDSAAEILDRCPVSWTELQREYRQAIARDSKLVLGYSAPQTINAREVWQQLVGIAKYLSRTQKTVTHQQLKEKLHLSDRTLKIGLQALQKIGFEHQRTEDLYRFSWQERNDSNLDRELQNLELAIAEQQFQQQYFEQVPLSTIERQLSIFS